MEDKDVLPFLNSLSPEQSKFADLIITEAERKGVPPRFALALAWHESKLVPNVMGDKDEIGIMQVRPGSAQMYGYDPKELTDPIKNIRIGIDILSRELERHGNDPLLAAIAYNAGPGLKYLQDAQNDDLPKSTIDYVKAIRDLGGFTGMPTQQEEQKDETAKSEQNLMQEFLSKFQDPEAKAQALTDLMAAGAGAAASKLGDIGKEGMGAARDVRAILAAQANAARAGVGTPPAPIPTDPMHTRMTQGTTDAGATGRQRMVFNTATAQQAAAKNLQEDVIKQLQRQGIVSESGRDILARLPGQTATPQGVLISAHQVYDDIPPPQGVEPRPKPNLMQRTGQATRNIAGGLGRAATVPFRSPVIAGALGGMGAMESGMEAQRRMKDNDMVGAGIAAAGLGGGLAALYPNPVVRGAGLITAAASPTAMYLYDKAKKAREEGAGLKPPSIYAPMYLR